jgi:16S rRNA (cytosine967-C5)-methyltransferase
MNPRIAANQQRTFLALLAQVLPHLRTDSALPRRIKDLLGRNRALGSRDRRLYRELLYTAIRFLPWLQPLLDKEPDAAARIIAWLAPDLKDTTAYRAALLEGWPPVPETLAEKSAALTAHLGPRCSPPATHCSPAALLPDWFRPHCPAAFNSPHLDALNERARLWVRLQCKETSVVLDEFLGRGWNVALEPSLPDAISLPPGAEVADTDAYRRGFVEIQDLGSQLVLRHVPIAVGQHWLDACAGAGGKTLQLARLVSDAGRVDATDIRPEMLTELKDRAARSRVHNIHILSRSVMARSPARRDDEAIRTDRHGAPRAPRDDQSATGLYDGVLIDAPCSGTGTWRRLPHMKWFTQPGMIPQFAAQQLAILGENAKRVRPGGLLVYATCSLSHVENHDVVAAFLAEHPDFTPDAPARDWGAVPDGLGHTLLPGTRNSDGFYVALLRRPT